MPLRRRPPSRIVRPLMLVGAVAALLALAAPALAGWSAPAALPLPSGAGGWYEDDVTVAPLPDGTVVAAVNANAGGFRAAVSVLSGGAWATQYLDALDSDDPMVSWDGAGQAVAVWRKPNGSGRTETFAARRETDGTWTSEGRITGTMHANFKLHGISRGPNGDIAVGLCPGRAPYVVRRVGGVWGAPVQVPASGVLSGIDCDDGRQLFATAQDGSGGTWVRAEVSGTMRVAYLNAAGTWQHQENLTAGGSNSYYQRLVVTGDGTPIAMWSTTTGDVTARVRTGGAWGTPQIVDDSGSATQTNVRLVASSYAAGAAGAWRNTVTCDMSMQCTYTTKGASRSGDAWGALQTLEATPRQTLGAPYPAVDAMGGAHYLQSDNGVLSAIAPAGATSAVAASGVTTVRGMAGDSRGRLVAVWSTTGSGYAASVLTQAPGAPTSAVASATGERAIQVTWSAPLVDGGASVTGYAVTTVPATTGCPSVTTTTCTLTGLDPNTTYAVSISAVNTVGTGSAAQASATTPAAAGVVTAATGQQAPAAAGGAGAGAGSAVRIAGATARPGGRIATSVTVAGPGRITVTGTRAGGRARPATVCATAKRVRKAGTFTLVCVADKATRAALRGRAVKVVLDVVFTPTGGAPTATTHTVTLPRAKRG